MAADPARRPVSRASGATRGRNGPGASRGHRASASAAPQAYGLPPIRWPEPFPGNTLFAMRTATFAKEIGRTVSFSLAAFRQAFAAGRDLSEPDNVFLAAASSELHPRSLEVAVERDAIKSRLREATDAPATRGRRGAERRRRRRGLLGRRPPRGGGRGRRGRRPLSYVAGGWLRRR